MCEGMHPYLFVRPIHCDKNQLNMLYGKGKNSMINTYWAVLVQEQNTLFRLQQIYGTCLINYTIFRLQQIYGTCLINYTTIRYHLVRIFSQLIPVSHFNLTARKNTVSIEIKRSKCLQIQSYCFIDTRDNHYMCHEPPFALALIHQRHDFWTDIALNTSGFLV